MIPIVLIATWLACMAGAFAVGWSRAPRNQHHSSALLLTGLCVCMHAAFGAHPAVPSFEFPRILVATVLGYSLLGGGAAYVVFRGCVAAGARLGPKHYGDA